MNNQNIQKDYTRPTKISWEALVVNLAKVTWRYLKAIFPIFILLFFDHDNRLWFAFIIIILMWLYLVVNELYSYFHTTFHIEDGKLLYHRRLLANTTERTIPLDRIHAYRTKSSFLYQMVNVVGIVFDTLAEKNEEVELILSEEDLAQFMAQVNLQGNPTDTYPAIEDTEESAVDASVPEKVVKYPLVELLKGALVQNHLRGLVVIGYVLWMIYSQVDQYVDDYIEEVADFTAEYVQMISWQGILSIFVLAYLISALLYIIVILLKYWGLTFSIRKDELTYSAGLLNHVTNKFTRNKVFGLTIRENLLEKKFKRQTIRLEQASNVGGKNQKYEITVIGTMNSLPLIDWWFGGEVRDETVVKYAHSNKSVAYVIFMRKWLWIIVPFIVLMFFFPLYSLPFLIIFGAIGYLDVQAFAKRSDITAGEKVITIHSGGLTRRTRYLSYSGIETVKFIQSPFAAKSRRKSIVINTNGGTYKVRSLKEEDAFDIINYILYRAEKSNLT